VLPYREASCNDREIPGHELGDKTMIELPANLAEMEIKVNERIPFWLADMIAAHTSLI
jgi:hypothetical protein